MGTEKNKGVLVVGELNMDLILSGIGALPEMDKEILAREMTLTMGSSSAIFASNLSVLGTKTGFAGIVGEDHFGDQIIKDLDAGGVDVKQVKRSKEKKTGITVVLSYDNHRANITYPGVMENLKESDISREALESSRHLHVSSIFMQPQLKDGIIKLFKRAREAGLTTSLDTQWDPEELWDIDWDNLLPLTDFFMPNSTELKSITNQTNVNSAIEKIAGIANTIVIKNGIEGSMAWQSGKLFKQKAFLNKSVKDTTGAGDSFNAGFIHQFLKGGSLEDCLEMGAICGAINTMEHGGTAAFLSKEKVVETAKSYFNYDINDL